MAESLVTRRRVLAGFAVGVVAVGTGGVLVEQGTLPGRARLHRALGLDGVDGTIPDVEPGPRTVGSFPSERRRAETGWSVSYPPGASEGDHLPVLLTLHGRSGDHTTAFDDLGFDRFLADAVGRGTEPFAIASVDGGTSYWHARADGTDSAAMLTGEFLPLLTERGLDPGRLSLLGWSMGGFGALTLASREDAPPLRSVSTLSAALFASYEASAEGAFDDEADFARHDVATDEQIGTLLRLPLRIDCGETDPFVDANAALRGRLTDRGEAPAGGIQPGGHTHGYWRRMAPEHLAFAARYLTTTA